MSTKKDLMNRPASGSALIWLETKITNLLHKLYVTKDEFSAELESRLEGVTGGTVSAGIYQYKGQVETYEDLPTDEMSDETIGYVYDVKTGEHTAGMNYAWAGDHWDNLGSVFEFIPLTNDELEVLFATPGVSIPDDDVNGFAAADLLHNGVLDVSEENNVITVSGIDAEVRAVEVKEGEPAIFAVPIAFGVDSTDEVTVTISADKCNEAYSAGAYSDTYTLPAAEVVKGILVPLGMKNATSSEKDIEFTETTVTLNVGGEDQVYTVVKGEGVKLYAFKSWTTSSMQS